MVNLFFLINMLIILFKYSISADVEGKGKAMMPVQLLSGEFPFQVSLEMKNAFLQRHICSAIIMHESFILTSAECFLQDLMDGPLTFVVRGGCIFLNDKNCFETQITSIQIHEKFEENDYDDNIAIAKMSSSLSENKQIKFAKLVKQEKPAKASRCMIISWLSLPEDEDLDQTLALYKIPVTIVDDSACAKHNWPKFVKEKMICGEAIVAGDKKVCDTAYGGAVVCHDVIRGLTRSPERCGGPTPVHTFMVDLSYYSDWIYDALTNFHGTDFETIRNNSKRFKGRKKTGAETTPNSTFNLTRRKPILLAVFTTVLVMYIFIIIV